MVKQIKKLVHNERGQALSEFAVVMPVLIMFIVGGLLLGTVAYNQMIVVAAANQGARTGAAVIAEEGSSTFDAADRARQTAENTLSFAAGGNCGNVNPARSGDDFVVEVHCDYNVPLSFLSNGGSFQLTHESEYRIFD
ncbi:TadE/TadG family type IV pilus assembly protein [Salibacterium aidingense]|uniref:TadE/TadG family type IV pilus assembly protein n=1 Tax=Salibacterium aidingense TaxID=384933 RepID=UPI00041C8D2D|nr:TadE/TadG family type IV pilus assembly protein [Salibacterium aidingense]